MRWRARHKGFVIGAIIGIGCTCVLPIIWYTHAPGLGWLKSLAIIPSVPGLLVAVFCRTFGVDGLVRGRELAFWLVHSTSTAGLWGGVGWLIGWAIDGIRRRRAPPDACRKCGYNLTGNVSGICPECGTPISAGARGHWI